MAVDGVRNPLPRPVGRELWLVPSGHGAVASPGRGRPYGRLMGARWNVELEPEVEEWLTALPPVHAQRAAKLLRRLKAEGNQLPMPHSRSLKGGLFELRLKLDGEARRITYCFGAGREILLLTTFRKQRQNEDREVARAREALRRSKR